MKKKILFVIDSLNCGGAEKSLISLLSLLDYSKYEVDLQLSKIEGMFLELLPKEVNILPELDFYKFCELSILSQIKTFNYNYMASKIKLFIMSRLNKNKLHGAQIFWKNCKNSFEVLDYTYDIAIAYNQGFPTYFVTDKVKATKKFAWVNTDYVKAGYKANIDEKYYDKFDNIVAVSEEAKIILENEFPKFKDKLLVIKDINNAELIKKMAEEKEVFKNVDDGITKIVTVGRLVALKGYDLAIDVARLLDKKGIQFKWYVIGEGPERGNIEELIEKKGLKDKFILLGEKANPYPYMKNCDIYVQTSRFEGFGLAIAEAKILNKVIITTDFDTAYNQIKNGENGIIVKKDSQYILDNIIKIISNKDLQIKFINNLNNSKKGNIEEVKKICSLLE